MLKEKPTHIEKAMTGDIELLELMETVYNRMAENSKPLDDDFARVLSEDMFDLF